jgi:hypothetical protein
MMNSTDAKLIMESDGTTPSGTVLDGTGFAVNYAPVAFIQSKF